MGDLLDLLDTDVPSGIEGQFQDLIIGAQKGSIRELSILARVHGTLPDPLTGQIHLIFLNYLNSSEVPIKPRAKTARLDEKRAFWSLWALAQLAGRLFKHQSSDLYGQAFVEAWPGIFKWSAYLHASRVQIHGKDQSTNTTSRQSRVIRDVIIGSWCTLCFSESAKEVMQKTHGVPDIATQLWISESETDASGVTPFCDRVPGISHLLNLITGPENGGEVAFDNLVSAAGGDVQLIARTACSRLEKAIKNPRFTDHPRAVDDVYIFMFFQRVCLWNPEVHEVFLNHGVIPICIGFLHWIASVHNDEPGSYEMDFFIRVMSLAFLFLWRSLETSTGVPWVLEAIDAGILSAFVECSPLFEDLSDEECITSLSSITTTIPQYLVYFCIVQAMDKSFLHLERSERFRSLPNTRVWEAFHSLVTLTSWRKALVGHFKQMEGEISSCYNPNCQKTDPRNKFRKCAKCGLTLYCSKECQTAHWKEYGHKKVCREPSKALNGLQGDGSITGRDWEYIQCLNICETRYHLPYLRRLASTKYPGVPLDNLSVIIDFTAVPTAFHITTNNRIMEDTWMIVIGDAHEMPKRRGKAISETYVVGIVPFSGKTGPTLLTMPFDREECVWDLDHDLAMSDGSKARIDPTGNKTLDWISEEAEARAKLYLDV